MLPLWLTCLSTHLKPVQVCVEGVAGLEVRAHPHRNLLVVHVLVRKVHIVLHGPSAVDNYVAALNTCIAMAAPSVPGELCRQAECRTQLASTVTQERSAPSTTRTSGRRISRARPAPSGRNWHNSSTGGNIMITNSAQQFLTLVDLANNLSENPPLDYSDFICMSIRRLTR